MYLSESENNWEILVTVYLENNGFYVSMFSSSAINNNVKFSYAIFHLEIKIALGNSSQPRVTIRLMKWLKQGHRETTLLFQAGALTKQSIFILGAPGPSRNTEQITDSDQAVYFEKGLFRNKTNNSSSLSFNILGRSEEHTGNIHELSKDLMSVTQ